MDHVAGVVARVPLREESRRGVYRDDECAALVYETRQHREAPRHGLGQARAEESVDDDIVR